MTFAAVGWGSWELSRQGYRADDIHSVGVGVSGVQSDEHGGGHDAHSSDSHSASHSADPHSADPHSADSHSVDSHSGSNQAHSVGSHEEGGRNFSVNFWVELRHMCSLENCLVFRWTSSTIARHGQQDGVLTRIWVWVRAVSRNKKQSPILSKDH